MKMVTNNEGLVLSIDTDDDIVNADIPKKKYRFFGIKKEDFESFSNEEKIDFLKYINREFELLPIKVLGDILGIGLDDIKQLAIESGFYKIGRSGRYSIKEMDTINEFKKSGIIYHEHSKFKKEAISYQEFMAKSQEYQYDYITWLNDKYGHIPIVYIGTMMGINPYTQRNKFDNISYILKSSGLYNAKNGRTKNKQGLKRFCEDFNINLQKHKHKKSSEIRVEEPVNDVVDVHTKKGLDFLTLQISGDISDIIEKLISMELKGEYILDLKKEK